MPLVGERTQCAGPVLASGSQATLPAQTGPASAALPVVRKAGRAATQAGAAAHASGLRVWRSLRLLSFIAVAIIPTALAAFYLFAVASDQFVAEFRFTLNSAEAPRFDPASLLAGITASAPPAALES
jgi:hypothetical protein